MLLFMVRHGETGAHSISPCPPSIANVAAVDNVAGVYAGVKDSALTNHGVLQANRLGEYFAGKISISHIFSSDLQRAFKTAEAIRSAQTSPPAETVKVLALREQDFGFYEGKAFVERARDSKKSGKEAHSDAHRNDPGFKDVESKGAMSARADTFVDEHLMPLFETADEKSVVVVSHGILLNHLWRSILRRFPSKSVSILPGTVTGERAQTLEYLGGWSNTGYLELDIRENTAPSNQVEVPSEDVLPNVVAIDAGIDADPTDIQPKMPANGLLYKTLVVKVVNGQEHLKGLKKTRGGIGSSKHDEGQKTLKSFFKKRKLG